MGGRNEWEDLRSTGGALVAADQAGRILFATDEARALLRRDDLEGAPLPSLMPERMRARHEDGFARFVSTGESRLQGGPVRVPALRGDGSEIEVELRVHVFRHADGRVLAVALLRDTTDERSVPPDVLQLETRLQRRAYRLL